MDTNSNNTKSIKRKVLDPLVEGYEFATQLQILLSRQHSNHHIDETRIGSGSDSVSGDPDPVDELLAKILGSFHETISVLESFVPLTVSTPTAVESSRNASCGYDSSAPASCNGGDSGDSRKRLGVDKSKRGCYTRKKRAHTWTVEARRIDEDGHAWRKYGQKEILHTKFPRSYFRCTHKPTQGCQAKRQVQKLEQNPEMFLITYTGYHTCNTNDQARAKSKPFYHESNMDSDNTLAATTAQHHVHDKVHQEQENNISSVTVVGTCMVKEEETNKEYCEASSKGEDLSLVWQDMMMMFDDHHQSRYYLGEISTTSQNFTFSDNDQFSSFFDPY